MISKVQEPLGGDCSASRRLASPRQEITTSGDTALPRERAPTPYKVTVVAESAEPYRYASLITYVLAL